MSRGKIFWGILSGFFILTSFGLSYYLYLKEKECLENSGAYTTGQVEEIIYFKGKLVKAYFKVNGKKYLASDKVYDARDPVKVGDRFNIHYCTENPKNNNIIFDSREQKSFQ